MEFEESEVVITNVVDHLPAAGSRSIMKLSPGRSSCIIQQSSCYTCYTEDNGNGKTQHRARATAGGLGLGLVIAVRWWGAGEGSG